MHSRQSPVSVTLDALEAMHSRPGPEHAKDRCDAEIAVVALAHLPYNLTSCEDRADASRCATDLLLWGRNTEALDALTRWHDPKVCERTLQCCIGASECASPASVAAVARLNTAETVGRIAERLDKLSQLELSWTGRDGIEYAEKERLRQAVAAVLKSVQQELLREPQRKNLDPRALLSTAGIVPAGITAIGLDKARPNSACTPR